MTMKRLINAIRNYKKVDLLAVQQENAELYKLIKHLKSTINTERAKRINAEKSRDIKHDRLMGQNPTHVRLLRGKLSMTNIIHSVQLDVNLHEFLLGMTMGDKILRPIFFKLDDLLNGLSYYNTGPFKDQAKQLLDFIDPAPKTQPTRNTRNRLQEL